MTDITAGEKTAPGIRLPGFADLAALMRRGDLALAVAVMMILVVLVPDLRNESLAARLSRWEQTFAESMVGEGDARTFAMQPSKLSEFVSLVREHF